MERARTMFRPDYLEALSPQSGGVAAHEARRLDGAGHRGRARDRVRGDDRLCGEESEGAGRAGAGHRERIQNGEGRGVRGQCEARETLRRRTVLVRRKKRDPASGLPFLLGDG